MHKEAECGYETGEHDNDDACTDNDLNESGTPQLYLTPHRQYRSAR